MSKPSFVYVTYIRSTPEKVWQALTDPATMKKYWFGAFAETDWKPGSPWTLKFDDGRVADAGEILESEPPKRLVIRWRNEWKPEIKAEGWSRCTMTIEPYQGVAQLTIRHELEGEGTKFIEAVSGGWPRILSNLKSLLETGAVAYETKA
jgi:uncharacterized protein YndB with AHSA1/START domain